MTTPIYTDEGEWQPVAILRVTGTPKAQPRAKATSMRLPNGKIMTRMYTPTTAKEWKKAIACAALGHSPPEPLAGPIKLVVHFFLPRPKRLCRKKDPDGAVRQIVKPDLDNLEKAVLDALTGTFYLDDCQVQDGHYIKWYHGKDRSPRATIWIYRWAQEQGDTT